jgi:hypothetical protein
MSHEWLANHTRNRVAKGGRLLVTDDELRFEPNAIEAAMGTEPWSTPLDAITAIDVAPARWHPAELFSGGLRKRLRVHVDGQDQLFVVPDPSGVAAVLSGLTAR